MRRDVYIENDSGGLSVVAGDAVDAIVDDARSDDLKFVTTYKALLLELYGDDSMPVRIVVDEPISPDEEAQWLARASWRIDASDGRLLVMGGFDPDVLAWWKEESGGAADGRGVAIIDAPPGSWRVDLYAHAGSMNGRQILNEVDEKPGTAFRRSHPGRAFPLWLATMLEFSGEDDPGHETAWRDVRGSIEAGSLEIDTDSGGVIGFLVHVTRFDGPQPDAPAGGWFERDANRRIPTTFPLGLPSAVPDPDLESFRDRLLGRKAPEPEPSIVEGITEVIEVWSGDPLRKLAGGSPPALVPTDAYFLYWIAALAADSPPRFELWVTPKGPWTAPPSTSEYAVVAKGGSVSAFGPAPNAGGWQLWWAARSACLSLAGVPDGSTIDLAMAPRRERDDDANPDVGRAIYSGTVEGGKWLVSECAPAVASETLQDAVTFVRNLVEHARILVRSDVERQAFEGAAAVYSPEDGSLARDDEAVSVTDTSDERTLLMLASSVFRTRFKEHWPVDVEEEW